MDLSPTAKYELFLDGRYATSFDVPFNGVYPLPLSTCFGTTRVAQRLNPLLTRYVPQNVRCSVQVSPVHTWSLPSWALENDSPARTLREVQQRDMTKNKAVSSLLSKNFAARQDIDYLISLQNIYKNCCVSRSDGI